MSFLFISHASADKTERIRPLVEALIHEGEIVWVDRPGVGTSTLGLDPAHVEAARIQYINSGMPWPQTIAGALSEAGAIVGCLSRASLRSVGVLKDELTFAYLADKLVTCIVDDLSYEELQGQRAGLLDLSTLQSPRIDCTRLAVALARIERGTDAVELGGDLLVEWQKLKQLIVSIDNVRDGPGPMVIAQIEREKTYLSGVPVGPILPVRDVPHSLLSAFAAHIDNVQRIERAFMESARLLASAFPAGFTERQIVLRRGEAPPFGVLSGETFWTQVFAIAGLKGRRTVASFFVSRIGRWALRRARVDHEADAFLSRLQSSGSVG